MPRKKAQRVVSVKEHTRRVRKSPKNPEGFTIVDQHKRFINSKTLDRNDLNKIVSTYPKEGLTFPNKDKLGFINGNVYDEIIAIWTDYFNRHFSSSPPLDPDVVKALIASESGFRKTTPENKVAFGIAQITKQTLMILQDPNGEAGDFVFSDIRKKDLDDPNVGIALGTRWLFRKRETARNRLKRDPSNEEVILEYKGLTNSKTQYRDSALKKYRESYAKLKKK